MILNINGEITSKLLDKLVQGFNDFDQLENEAEKLTIYLNSIGGNPALGLIIVDMIDSRKNKITLIASDCINSTAFEMFVLAQCDKKILAETTGVYHCASREIQINVNGKPKTPEDVLAMEKLMNDKYFTLKVCNLTNMSDEEKYKILELCEDVTFSYERLKKILIM